MSGRAGFTLLEMLVVVVVIGVALTIALPRVDLLRLRVHSTERQVSMTLLRAQRLAIMRQHDVHVRFDTAAGALVLHADADGDGESEAGENEWRHELERGVRFVRGSVPAGPPGDSAIGFRRRQQEQPVLTYHRSGSASEAGGFYLGTVRSAGGTEEADARALMVDRASGLVRRFSLEGGVWVQD